MLMLSMAKEHSCSRKKVWTGFVFAIRTTILYPRKIMVRTYRQLLLSKVMKTRRDELSLEHVVFITA